MNPLPLILTLSFGAFAASLDGNDVNDVTLTLPESDQDRTLFFRNVAPLALFYAIGGEEYVCKMKEETSDKLILLVALTDHFGMFGGKHVPWEKLPDQVAPLIQKDTKEMVFFLRDWCCRIDFTELGMIKNLDPQKLDTTLKRMKARNHQDMLESAKEYVENVIQNYAEESFFSKASALAVSCALGDENQVQNISYYEYQTILRYAVVCDFYDSDAPFQDSWEKFTEHVQPYLETPEKLSVYLQKLCCRVCSNLVIDRMLSSAKKFVDISVNDPVGFKVMLFERCTLAIDYLMRGEEQVYDMNLAELQKIVHLAYMALERILKDDVLAREGCIEYVRPLLHGSAKERYAFLLDLCARVCAEQLKEAQEAKAAQAQPRPL